MTEQFCWLPKTEQLDIMEMSSMARASNPTSRAKAVWLDAFFGGDAAQGAQKLRLHHIRGGPFGAAGAAGVGCPMVPNGAQMRPERW